MKNEYIVIVGNIGTVCETNNFKVANGIYQECKKQSIAGYGRAGNECVTLFKGGDPIKEWVPFKHDETEL